MSRKPSHIPLFPDAYHRDTTHLSTEEHGAYFLLLMAAWGTDDCSLPNDERRLAALAKMTVPRWRKVAPTILEFWTGVGERIAQERLRKEWAYVHRKREKAKEAVELRWAREKGYARNTSEHTPAIHLGGGGGEGGGSLANDEARGDSETVHGPAFRVVGGGK